MPIPVSRSELIDSVTSSFEKLRDDLDEGGSRLGSQHAVGDWSVKELLAVRAWWTERVIDWVEAGERGESPTTPAVGFKWSETPRLNDETAQRARHESYRSIRGRLEAGYQRVLSAIASLDDAQLCETGVFDWAGKWPVARWISINTARQYASARTHVRRAVREMRRDD